MKAPDPNTATTASALPGKAPNPNDPKAKAAKVADVAAPAKKRTPKSHAKAPEHRKRAPIETEGALQVARPVVFSDQGIGKALAELLLACFDGQKQPLNARIVKRAFHYAQQNVHREFLYRKRNP